MMGSRRLAGAIASLSSTANHQGNNWTPACNAASVSTLTPVSMPPASSVETLTALPMKPLHTDRPSTV